MKKCEKCNIDMVPAELHGEPFDIDLDKEINDFSIRYINGSKEVKGLFGGTKKKKNYRESKLNAMVCPMCGKVELYVDSKKILSINNMN